MEQIHSFAGLEGYHHALSGGGCNGHEVFRSLLCLTSIKLYRSL